MFMYGFYVKSADDAYYYIVFELILLVLFFCWVQKISSDWYETSDLVYDQ